MSSMDPVELLRRRAVRFYDYARIAFDNGDYDMTVFMCEQAAQLYTKSLLLRMLGFTPRGHRVRELLGVLLKALDRLGRVELSQEIARFNDVNKDALRLLEETYTSSRCPSGVYGRRDALKALKVVEELFKLLEVVERSVFST
ncbi:MAG: HEPN domain-containing protein [Acidilobaceae archaeon]